MTSNRNTVHVPLDLGEPKRPHPERMIYLDGPQQLALDTRRSRLGIVMAVFAVAFAILGFRLAELSMFNVDRDVRLARQTGYTEPVIFRRNVVDRHGNIIAADLGTMSLFADGRDILDAQVATDALVGLFPDINPQKTLQKLSSGRPFVWVRRDLTPVQQAEVNGLGIPGLYFKADRRRVYTNGPLVSHVIGYVGTDNVGLAGIERSMEKKLLDPSTTEPLALTLDLRVQHVLRQELNAAIDEFKAIGASGVVLDANSGEILAMVSLPDYDPNDFRKAKPNQLFNRASLGVYEMGSTFKAFNTAMALDAGVVRLTDSIDATKPYKVANRIIHDFHPENRWLTVGEVFMYSSNIGSARIAHRVGASKQEEFLHRLGLLDRSGIELAEVGSPLLPAKWGPTESATVSFGHGISVSPIQVASAIGALANGGLLIEPTLVRDKKSRNKAQQVVSVKTSLEMRQLMRQVVTEGTGKKAEALGYSVAGKTGTAEKAKNGGYSRKSLLTSFVGVFPSDTPKYLVLVVLDEPKGNKSTFGYATAGWTAAPVVGRVVGRIAPVLGVRPLREMTRLGKTQLAAQRDETNADR